MSNYYDVFFQALYKPSDGSFSDFSFLNSLLNKDIQELEMVLKEVAQNYSKQKDLLLKHLSEILARCCKWLKENPISKKVPSLFRFVIYIYEIIGFQVDFNIQDYYKSSTKFDENDPSKLEKQNLEGFENDKENRLENPLLNFDIFHLAISIFNSIVTKNQVTSFKSHLIVLLPIFSIYATDKKIQDLIRRQKFIKIFLNLFKELLQESQKLQPIDFEMANYIFQILAKLTFRNKKNQDYFVKKNGHEFIKSILASSKDLNLTQAGIYTLANCCDKNDTRLLLWCGGFLSFALKKLIEKSESLLTHYKNNSNVPERKTEIINVYKEIEVYQLLVWKMSLDTDEIIEECINSTQLQQTFQILDQLRPQIFRNDNFYPYYVRCAGIAIAIIRRLASTSKTRKACIDKYLGFVFDTLFKFEIEIESKNEEIGFLFKELNATFGVFSLDSLVANELISKGVPLFVIKISLNYFDNAKLIKTSLGFLTNFASIPKARELLSKEKDFYVLVYNVLEKYDYSGAIIEYCFKMILNMLQDPLCFKNFSFPKFIFKLLFLWFLYKSDEINSILLIKILKNLCSKTKVFEAFMVCVKELESSNKDFNLVNVLMENMKSCIESPQSLFEVIMFLSILTQNDEGIKTKFGNNEAFVTLIKDFIDLNKKDKEILQKFSSYIAYLPIEEFNFIF